jgi:hypothetical protein
VPAACHPRLVSSHRPRLDARGIRLNNLYPTTSSSTFYLLPESRCYPCEAVPRHPSRWSRGNIGVGFKLMNCQWFKPKTPSLSRAGALAECIPCEHILRGSTGKDRGNPELGTQASFIRDAVVPLAIALLGGGKSDGSWPSEWHSTRLPWLGIAANTYRKVVNRIMVASIKRVLRPLHSAYLSHQEPKPGYDIHVDCPACWPGNLQPSPCLHHQFQPKGRVRRCPRFEGAPLSI